MSFPGRHRIYRLAGLGLGLLFVGWSIKLLADGLDVSAGFVALFGMTPWISLGFRTGRRYVKGVPLWASTPFAGVGLGAVAFAAFALALGVCEVVGLGMRRDVVRGLLALVGCAIFASVAFRVFVVDRRSG